MESSAPSRFCGPSTEKAASKKAAAASAAAASAAAARDALPVVDAGEMEKCRAVFNECAGPKAMVFFSSSCPACNDGSRALNEMLSGVKGDAKVFAVWEPIEAKDAPPPPSWLANLNDARVVQLWDPGHLFSSELRAAERAHPGSPAQARLRTDNDADGILYDTAVVFPAGSRWEQSLPAPDFVDGGVAAVLPRLRERLSRG